MSRQGHCALFRGEGWSQRNHSRSRLRRRRWRRVEQQRVRHAQRQCMGAAAARVRAVQADCGRARRRGGHVGRVRGGSAQGPSSAAIDWSGRRAVPARGRPRLAAAGGSRTAGAHACLRIPCGHSSHVACTRAGFGSEHIAASLLRVVGVCSRACDGLAMWVRRWRCLRALRHTADASARPQSGAVSGDWRATGMVCCAGCALEGLRAAGEDGGAPGRCGAACMRSTRLY